MRTEGVSQPKVQGRIMVLDRAECIEMVDGECRPYGDAIVAARLECP
jgi:hypothetical protein